MSIFKTSISSSSLTRGIIIGSGIKLKDNKIPEIICNKIVIKIKNPKILEVIWFFTKSFLKLKKIKKKFKKTCWYLSWKNFVLKKNSLIFSIIDLEKKNF